jgi:hypothetical protein
MKRVSLAALCWILLVAPAVAAEEEGDVAERSDEADDDERPPPVGLPPTELRGGGSLDDGADDGLRFHGYLRVPLRAGVGEMESPPDGVEGGSKTHVAPRVPDGAYTDWQYIHLQPGPWTELWLSYGAGRASVNVSIAAYDIRDASYADLISQLGINQAFVSLRWPKVLGGRGDITWNVGAFSSRYGAAGRWDAGRYETYLFGATHAAGETLTTEWRIGDGLVLMLEHGLGAKLQAVPHAPGAPDAPYLPYPGDVPQGTTLLHHGHVGLGVGKHVTFGAHYLTTWTDDAENTGEVDGRVTVVGGEAKVVGHRFGDFYLGAAHLDSRDPLRLSGALEVLHSFEGWSLRDNYFGNESTGTGTIDTLLWQHTFSVSRFLWHPREFWGQGPDLQLTTFAMYNRVASDDPMFTGATAKLKLGGDVLWTPRPSLGFGARWDLVQPDMNDSTESFQVLSVRAVVRTRFTSNEEIWVQWSHYWNGENVRVAYPYEGMRPDSDVLSLSAVMWW